MDVQLSAERPAGVETAAPARRRRWLRWSAAFLVVCAGLLVWLFVEPRAVTVADYRIGSPELPAAFDGTRVVFLADIHHGPFLGRGRVRSLVDRVNAMLPDLIVLGGDYVHGSAEYAEPCFRELARLRAPLGVYAVLGNHDHWEGARQTRNAMRAAGITLVDNSGVWIARSGARIRLGGVGDLWEDRQVIAAALGETRRGDFMLLVSHNPDYHAKLMRPASAGVSNAVAGSAGDSGSSASDGGGSAGDATPAELVDLVLAGHTHGGQVTLFGLWAPAVPSDHGQRFRTGLIDGVDSGPNAAHAGPPGGTPHVPMIVSNGIGTISPPMRFCAPPQIVNVVLERLH